MITLEMWKIDQNNVFAYTEDYQLAKCILVDNKGVTVYYRHNLPFAWQFFVPNKYIILVLKKYGVLCDQVNSHKRKVIDAKSVIENKELTGIAKPEFEASERKLAGAAY